MFTTLLAAFTLSAPVPKLAPELKWRFAKGDTFYVTRENDVTTIQKLSLQAEPTASTSRMVFVYQLTVMAAGEKETAIDLEFLSAERGDGGGAALEELPGLAGKKVTLTLDAAHTVTKAEGAGADGTGKLIEEDTLKHMVNDLFRAVPGKSVAQGAMWSDEQKGPVMNDVTAKRTFRGTVGEPVNGLIRLEAESEQTWTGGKGYTMTMKGEKGKRTVLFDAEAGRVRKLTDEFTLTGKHEFPQGDQFTIHITSRDTLTYTVTDEKPKLKAKK